MVNMVNIYMKLCNGCNTKKELTEFNKNASKKDGHQANCRECSKTHNKKHYIKNKKSHRAKVLVRKREVQVETRALISEVKQVGCACCDESDPCCLDFHHKDPNTKEFTIASAQSQGYSVERMRKEIDKCVVVCANCHRKIHHNVIACPIE